MFEGFEQQQIVTSGTTINLVVGGSGPPLLLLHGYPQTHVMWHKVAPRLAQQYTVVAADLRGYGDSGKPPSDPEHLTYSKKAMAQDQAEVMMALGFDTFYLAAHDRGARVAHRLTLDYPDRIRRLTLLDIVPTREMFGNVSKAFALSAWHWFFLAQPYDLPERLIGGASDYFLRSRFDRTGDPSVFPAEAVDEYARCFEIPGAIHAICEDYRAGAGIDLVHDEADYGRKITAPLQVLWSPRGGASRGRDPLAVWHEYATDVRGHTLPCGHYLAEEKPDEVYDAIRTFFV